MGHKNLFRFLLNVFCQGKKQITASLSLLRNYIVLDLKLVKNFFH